MEKVLKILPVALLFLAGLSLLLYPLVANEWNSYRQKKLISTYEEAVSESSGSIDYEAEWEKANAYNEALLPSVLPDSFAIAASSGEPDEEYMSCLNLTGDGTIGVVEIPKINVKLPIYHTTDSEILEKGAGHLEGSSLPVGGENTHAVISAHRGLPSASLFTDLDKLEIGDHFLIYVLDATLCYEVDQIKTVEPEDTEALSVEYGQDLVTLLTCTPYGVNTHRLLVRGHRVDYEEEVVAEEEDTATPSMHTNYGFWVILGLVITAVFIVGMEVYTRKHGGFRRSVPKQQTEAAREPEEPDETAQETTESMQPDEAEQVPTEPVQPDEAAQVPTEPVQPDDTEDPTAEQNAGDSRNAGQDLGPEPEDAEV